MEPHHEFSSVKSRAQAMEDAFFAERDKQLLESLQRKITAEEKQRVLASAIGISEMRLLEAATGLHSGLQISAIAALLPLIEVAWCDGDVAPEERNAILKAANEMEVPLDPTLHQLLDKWLGMRPSATAVTAWKEYIHALCTTLDPTTRVHLRDAIMGRARQVAEAAGEFLGFGSKISHAEQNCLDAMTQAFNV